MKLYLIQHGQAVPEERGSQRPLSREGKERTKKMARYLKSKNIKVDYLWHSLKLRALQTAEIILKSISCSEVCRRNDLNPLDPVDKLSQEIRSFNKDLMIVGHLPHLEKLASLLLSGSETCQLIAFKNSGVVCLEYSDKWKISWMIVPDLIK